MLYKNKFHILIVILQVLHGVGIKDYSETDLDYVEFDRSIGTITGYDKAGPK